MKKKRLIALLLALVMAFTLAACSSSSSSDEASDDASASADSTTTADTSDTEETGTKTFVYGTDSNSTTFDPAADLQTNSGNTMLLAVLETLWTVDSDGTVQMELAESYEWTGDLELTITMPSGVVFSNGSELTSDDVLYTLEHMRDTSRTETLVDCIDFDNTYCPDDTTIVITFSYYSAAFYENMADSNAGIIDRETCEAYGDTWGWIVGTGPYMLQGDGETDTSGWEESVQYTLVRNENYRGEEPYYDEIIIKFYSEESTRYSEFQAGNLDAVYLTEGTYVSAIANGDVEGAYHVQRTAATVYGFALAATSETSGSMSDINIRKAFAHALDIETMIEEFGEGIYAVATSIIGEDNWAYVDVGTYEYDPEYAAECLAEAGYSVDNPLTLYLVAESTSFQTSIAEAAQAYLAEVGINLDLTNLGEFSTILPVLLEGSGDVTFGGSSSGGIDPSALLTLFSPTSDNSMMKLVDEDLIEIYNTALSSTDQEERAELYAELQQEIHDQYLYIPMWQETKNFGVLDEHTSFESALDASNQLDATKLTD